MFPRDIIIRNIQAEELFEVFFISAIASVFTIRIFLFLTNYPQLGGGNLHIAHMLWGGFFMLIAIVMFLAFLNKGALWIAAAFGGVGFGAFIDELGKFITRDNNYFYKPTIAFIYIIFVVLYLLFKAIPKYKSYTKKEYLINAIDMAKEAIIDDLDIEEERLAYKYLKQCDPNDPIVKSLYDLLSNIDAEQARNPGFFTRLRKTVRRRIIFIARSHLLANVVVLVLIMQSFLAVGVTVFVSYSRISLSFDKWGVLISSFISAIFIIYGVFFIPISKRNAYQQFKTAVLVSIFLTQFFVFYSAQFYALISLFFNIMILFVIDYVLTVAPQKSS